MMLILDAEGVVFDAEYLPRLAAARKDGKTIGVKVDQITQQGIQGQIDWEEGLRARIDALRGTPYELCLKIANSQPLTPGITEMCHAIKQAGWQIVVVSGGFSMMFSDNLRQSLGLDMVLSNYLVFDEQNKLDGVRINVGEDKAATVRAAFPDVSPDHMACIVDGANDISLMKMCKVGIAHASTCDAIKKQADVILERGEIQTASSIIMERMGLDAKHAEATTTITKMHHTTATTTTTTTATTTHSHATDTSRSL